MFTLESPANDEFPYNSFDDFFNWTMTYRLDRYIFIAFQKISIGLLILRKTRILKMRFLCYSDFPSPYGSLVLKKNNKFSDDQSADFDFRKMKMKNDAIPTNLSDSIEVKISTLRSLILCMNDILLHHCLIRKL